MDEKEVAAKIGAAIASVMAEQSAVTIKWCAAVEVLDTNGERILWTLAPDGQTSWDTLGLLRFAEHQETSD